MAFKFIFAENSAMEIKLCVQSSNGCKNRFVHAMCYMGLNGKFMGKWRKQKNMEKMGESNALRRKAEGVQSTTPPAKQKAVGKLE